MNQNNNRTINTKRNLVAGAVSKIFLLGATFIVRTIFIRVLGAEYTGINSLFTNILSFLNLAEMGMGSVFIYELYKPLKNGKQEEVNALVYLFRKIYRGVILAVAIIGIAVIPFLHLIVKSSINNHLILVYYILYLLDSVSSYFFVYKTMVIEADQKRYITNLVEISCKFFMYVLQSIYLILKKDFIGYLIIQVIFTIIKNISLHIIASRMYPYLNRKSEQYSGLNVTKISENVKATFVAKIANVVLNQTDSIIISIMFGTIFVGYYSNYYMLIVYINSIYYIITTSLEASVGNLNAEGNIHKSFAIYKKLNFVISLLNSLCVTGFICIVQDFIKIWIGKEYIQSMLLIYALMISFYLQQSMSIVSLFRQTYGLFIEVQNIYILMAGLNIVFSILFGKIVGVAGVALATGFSRLVTVFWYEGKVVFKKMKVDIKEYLQQQIQGIVTTVFIVGICLCICNSITVIQGLSAIIVKGVIVVVLWFVSNWIVYKNSEEWKWGIDMVYKKFKKFS